MKKVLYFLDDDSNRVDIEPYFKLPLYNVTKYNLDSSNEFIVAILRTQEDDDVEIHYVDEEVINAISQKLDSSIKEVFSIPYNSSSGGILPRTFNYDNDYLTIFSIDNYELIIEEDITGKHKDYILKEKETLGSKAIKSYHLDEAIYNFIKTTYDL